MFRISGHIFLLFLVLIAGTVACSAGMLPALPFRVRLWMLPRRRRRASKPRSSREDVSGASRLSSST